jgi:hypothetical protein
MLFSQERFNAWGMADPALEVRPFANADRGATSLLNHLIEFGPRLRAKAGTDV